MSSLSPSGGEGDCYGFVFAFKLYSRMHARHPREMLVQLLTASDLIHVSIIPVMGHCHDIDGVKELIVADVAMTACAGQGFVEHPADRCLNTSFGLLYVPLCCARTLRGLHFLISLRGAGYNYVALPLAALPRWVKRRMGCSSPTPAAADGDAISSLYRPTRVSSGHVGLLLSQRCSVLQEYDADTVIVDPFVDMDPKYCLPGELFTALQRSTHAQIWSTAAVRIRLDVTVDLLAESMGMLMTGNRPLPSAPSCPPQAAAGCSQ